MAPPLIYFIRHGQTEFNLQHRFQGQQDIELNDTGRAQARRNGKRLRELMSDPAPFDPAPFDFVASPMRRARETMEIVRGALGLPPQDYRTDPRLVEVHFGDWHGHTYAELEASDPGVHARRQRAKWTFVPPGQGAESYQMLEKRVKPWFDSVARPTVCVAHGGVIRVVFRLMQTLTPAEAADLEVPQDRILRLRDGRLDWL